jgi:hypothetical protein
LALGCHIDPKQSMPSVPPLYEQVQQGSARRRARDRALAWLERPSYGVAVAAGALFGIGSAIVDSLDRELPSLMPRPPLSPGQTLVEALSRAVLYAVIAVGAAALLRFARWAYFRARFGAQAT